MLCRRCRISRGAHAYRPSFFRSQPAPAPMPLPPPTADDAITTDSSLRAQTGNRGGIGHPISRLSFLTSVIYNAICYAKEEHDTEMLDSLKTTLDGPVRTLNSEPPGATKTNTPDPNPPPKTSCLPNPNLKQIRVNRTQPSPAQTPPHEYLAM